MAFAFDVTVKEGQDAILPCSLTGSIKWSKENKTISSNHTVLIDGSLKLYSPKGIQDSGMYNCSNEKDENDSVNLIIKFFTMMTFQKNITSLIGESNQRFICSASSDSPMSITWKRDGKLLFAKNYETKAKYRKMTLIVILIINKPDSTLAGEYTCHGDSASGRKTLSAGYLSMSDECRHPTWQWKCPKLKKCIYKSDHCDNRDDCGDLTDETVNCSLPFISDVSAWFNRRDFKSIHINVKQRSTSTLKIIYNISGSDGYKRNGEFPSWSKKVEGLKNGTTYRVTVRPMSYMGLGAPKVFNITIPSILPPTQGNFTGVTIYSRRKLIDIAIHANNPTQGLASNPTQGLAKGHRNWFNAKLTYCKVNTTGGQLYSCVYQPEKGFAKSIFLDLQPATKYKFTIYFINEAGQRGPPSSMFYTTPEREQPTPLKRPYGESGSLGTGTIVGIVIASISILISCIGGIIKYCCNQDESYPPIDNAAVVLDERKAGEHNQSEDKSLMA